MTEVTARGAARGGFEDEFEDPPVRALTHEEAQALRARTPFLSPWRVIAVQAAVGLAVAALAWLITGERYAAVSALYGAGTAVLPGALMARGMTRRIPGMSPVVSAIGVLWWGFVKVGFSIVMLLLASTMVQPLSWPALLAALAVCVQVYWLALLWRGR